MLLDDCEYIEMLVRCILKQENTMSVDCGSVIVMD